MRERAANENPTDSASTLRELVDAISEQRSIEISLRELNGRFLTVQDQERRRIARDLHDSLGQTVALLKMNLERLARSPSLTPEGAELLAQSSALADSMSTELRTIAHLLHPPLLDELGLMSALQSLTAGFSERSGIHVTLQMDKKFGRLPGEVEISIYRIVQESLTNIHRHSQSPTARISIERRHNEIRIEIEDHGNGIAAGGIAGASGVGLGGMRERARLCGGSLDVKSSDKGTIVVARLPVTAATLSARSAAASA